MSLATIVGTSFLKLGSTGPVVEAIQLALRDLGYGLKGTAYFGNATDTAVRAFQRRAGLTPDGVVGEKTAKAIDAASSATGTPLPVSVQVAAEITRPLWLEAGLALVGTKERLGGKDNDIILSWAQDEGGDIAKDYKHTSIPWCALIQNHMLTKVSLPGTETLWALDFNADLMKQRLGHGWPAVKLSGPAVGAFAPMVRDGGGHVICVVGKARNGNIMGLGGNQSDTVSVIEFAPSRLNRGFWWPESVAQPHRIGFDLLPIVTSSGKVSSIEA